MIWGRVNFPEQLVSVFSLARRGHDLDIYLLDGGGGITSPERNSPILFITLLVPTRLDGQIAPRICPCPCESVRQSVLRGSFLLVSEWALLQASLRGDGGQYALLRGPVQG